MDILALAEVFVKREYRFKNADKELGDTWKKAEK
jgi:hypothetical protein